MPSYILTRRCVWSTALDPAKVIVNYSPVFDYKRLNRTSYCCLFFHKEDTKFANMVLVSFVNLAKRSHRKVKHFAPFVVKIKIDSPESFESLRWINR